MRAFFAAASLLAILCFCGSARSLFAAPAAYEPAILSGQAQGAPIYYNGGLYAPQVQSLEPMQSVVPIQIPQADQQGYLSGSSMAIAAAVVGAIAGRWLAKEQMEKSRAQVARFATLAVGGQQVAPTDKYAIVEASGHQLWVEEGKFYDFDRMASLDSGDKFKLNKIFLVKDGEDPLVGKPFVEEYTVEATVLRHHQGPKIRVFKYRPKKRTRKTRGHRTQLTRVLIDSIKRV